MRTGAGVDKVPSMSWPQHAHSFRGVLRNAYAVSAWTLHDEWRAWTLVPLSGYARSRQLFQRAHCIVFQAKCTHPAAMLIWSFKAKEALSV